MIKWKKIQVIMVLMITMTVSFYGFAGSVIIDAEQSGNGFAGSSEDKEMANSIRLLGIVFGGGEVKNEKDQEAMNDYFKYSNALNKCSKWAELNYSQRDRKKAIAYCMSEHGF